jgi:hypothetical protein
MVDNSPQVMQMQALQWMADNRVQNSPFAPIQRKENNTGLPDNLKTGMENLSGISLDDVKVHRDSDKPAQLQAHAYAQGTDIHLGAGQEKHLPHEAWHVVQQKQGRVKPTMQMKGKVNVNDDAGLEKEADMMGAKALQLKIDDKRNVDNIKEYGSSTIQLADELGPQQKRRALDDRSDEKIMSRGAEESNPENASVGNQGVGITEDTRLPDRILKFNFAGSGEHEWKTRKTRYLAANDKKQDKRHDPSKKHLERRPDSEGEKYSQEKEKKKVIEYAGPLEKRGAVDKGENSTENNLEDAKTEFLSYMLKYRTNGSDKTVNGRLKPIQINIKGFSRGAATASVFAAWIKTTVHKNLTNVNLVLIDPVQGTGFIAGGLMPEAQDVSSVYKEEAPDTTGTTLFMPIKSGMPGNPFTAQKISGYQRIIIGYGQGIKHSFGLGENESATLKYNGKNVKGMQLSKLPKGLFVVNATNMQIIQINTMSMWRQYEAAVLGKANKKEGRDVVIEEALKQFFV